MIEREVKIDPPPSKEQCAKGVVSHGLSSYGVDLRLGWKFKVFTNVASAVVDPKNFDPHSFVDVDVTPHEGTHLFHDNHLAYEHDEGSQDHYCLYCKKFKQHTKNFPKCVKRPPSPDFVIIPPNSFALGESLETVEIPRSVLGICLGKSTYARCGIVTNCTPLEPEWRGKITIEISNTTPLPAKVYAGEGIIQVLFIRSDGYRDWTQNATEFLLKALAAVEGITADQVAEIFDRLNHATCRTSYADRRGRYQNQKEITLPTVNKE